MTDIQVAEAPGTGPDGNPRPTEDVVVLLGQAVVLLDGATSLHPDRPSGGWYAATLAARIAAQLTAYPAGKLTDVLADAIAAVVREHGLRPRESPSSTVAMLRWDTSTVDALVLADSPVIAFTDDGEHALTDNRLAELPRRGSYRERLRDGGGYGPDHVTALRESAGRFDSLRNVEGGFWVAEALPEAAYRACTASWSREQVHAVLLASDGVSCGVDDYRIFAGWSEVLGLARTRGAKSALDIVTEAERGDPDGSRWPRPKVHDDKTLALVDFGGSRSS